MKTGRLHVVGPPLHGAAYFLVFLLARCRRRNRSVVIRPVRWSGFITRAIWRSTPAIMPFKPRVRVVYGAGGWLADATGIFIRWSAAQINPFQTGEASP